MPRIGLNKDTIINASITLIEENKFCNFTIHSLARFLNIKPSSLYNHIKNMDELLSEICHSSIKILNKYQLDATNNTTGDDTFWKLACAYRTFVKEHPELYNVIINIYKIQNEKSEIDGLEIAIPFMLVLDKYQLTSEEKAHWQRIFRAILHGFVSQEDAGYFSHYNIDEEQTFKMAINCYIDGLNQYITNKEGNNHE